MNTVRFWETSVICTWKELCQRRRLLAELVLLCLALPMCAGPAARPLRSHAAACAPRGNPVGVRGALAVALSFALDGVKRPKGRK